MLLVLIYVGQVESHEVLFAGGKDAPTAPHKVFFPRQVLDESGYGVQRAHDDVQSRVVEDVDITPIGIQVPDREWRDTLWVRFVVSGSGDGGVEHKAAAATAELLSALVGGIVGDHDPVEHRLLGIGQ